MYCPRNSLGIGIEKEFRRIKSVTIHRCIRTMHTIAIELPRSYLRQVNMPDLICLLRHWNPGYLTVSIRSVKETQLYPRGILRKECKIDTCSVPSRTQWIGVSRPHFQ